jgi:hypothetical protein
VDANKGIICGTVMGAFRTAAAVFFYIYKYIKIIFIFLKKKFIFTINIYKRSKNIKKYFKKKQLNHALKHPIKRSMIIHAI